MWKRKVIFHDALAACPQKSLIVAGPRDNHPFVCTTSIMGHTRVDRAIPASLKLDESLTCDDRKDCFPKEDLREQSGFYFITTSSLGSTPGTLHDVHTVNLTLTYLFLKFESEPHRHLFSSAAYLRFLQSDQSSFQPFNL